MLRRRQPVGRRGPGLARTVGRTAVIAGTATAVSGAVAGAQAQRQQVAQQQTQQQADERLQLADLQQQVSQMQAQEMQAQMTPAGGADDMIGQLARLGELHQQGILSSDEFAAAKAKLLGM